MTNTIRVEIDAARFWQIGQPVHQHIYVGKALRDAGVPIIGGLEIQGIEHGRLVQFNETRDGKTLRVFEWTPGTDTPAARPVSSFFD